MLRRALLVIAVFLAAFFTATGVAAGQDIPNDAPAVAPVAELTLNAFVVLVISSFLIPLATGLITKLSASATVKQVVTLILSALTGVITTSTQVDGTAIISMTTVQYSLLALGIAIVSYLGVYQPHDANAKLAPDVGVG